MKITYHESTGRVYIKTETVDDHFLLGKIAGKLKNAAGVYGQCDNQRELQTDLKALLELAAA